MSTDYALRDTFKAKHLTELKKEIANISQQYLDTISAFQVDPTIQDIKSSFIRSVQHAIFVETYDLVSHHADTPICTVTKDHIIWHADNGFFDISSVKKRMSGNANLIIVDEYGKPLSLEKLQSIADARNNTFGF